MKRIIWLLTLIFSILMIFATGAALLNAGRLSVATPQMDNRYDAIHHTNQLANSAHLIFMICAIITLVSWIVFIILSIKKYYQR